MQQDSDNLSFADFKLVLIFKLGKNENDPR